MECHKLYKFLCCVLGALGILNSIYNCLIYDLKGRSTSPKISSAFSSFSFDKIPFLNAISFPFCMTHRLSGSAGMESFFQGV